MTTAVINASADEILAATAHELRLPLSHIKGFVSSLRRTDVEWDDQTRNDFIAEIDLETDRLAELVDLLLDAGARESASKPIPDLTFAPPAAVVEGALRRVRLPGQRRLRIDVPSTVPSVQMNTSQMERVLVNLVENAIKYSSPGTPIGITAQTTRHGGLKLSVEDEGPGIPAGDRERIFEPFFRSPTAIESNVPGHGLGLAISQSIVLAHGGRIEVTDRPGGGACFSVFLPAHVQARQFDRDNQLKDRGTDPANNSRCGRRSPDAHAPVEQPQGQRVRRPRGKRWLRSAETHRGAPVRPAAS
jgi:two-component system, OmpR family, sensor histidine kinase KdpD